MPTSTAIGAWDRLPVGCAVLVIVLLSLLLWAILLILLWRLFVTEGIADIQEDIKSGFVTRSCVSATHSVRGIAADGFNGLHRTGKAGLIGLAHSGAPSRDELSKFIGNQGAIEAAAGASPATVIA